MFKSLSRIYDWGQSVRRAAYDKGLLAVERVDGVTVICIGNIAVGGRGKTPLAMLIARQLKHRGVSTALALRGYKGTLEHQVTLASDGKKRLVPVEGCGDEAAEASLACPGVPVYTGAHRVKVIRRAQKDGIQVVVLDDGFQHRRLYRDLDIVCITPSDLDPHTQLLPAGPLREDAAALKRASLTAGYAGEWYRQRADAPEGEIPKAPDDVTIMFETVATGLMHSDGTIAALSTLKNLRVLPVCAIAAPYRFEKTLSEIATMANPSIYFNDHHRYTSADVTQLNRQAPSCDLIVTTMKDFVKLRQFDFKVPLCGLQTELQIIAGNDRLQVAVDRILPTLAANKTTTPS